ncbi:MAG: enolase C-terminal domain-like protein, partial [Sphingomonadales bacterium]
DCPLAYEIDGLALLQDEGVSLAELPISAKDFEGMKFLCFLFDLAIMADEALTGPKSAWDFATQSAADVFAVKINQSGGLNAARIVADVAQLSHIAVYGGTMLEAGIGTIASAQLFATFDTIEWGTELFGPLLMTEEILVEPLTYRDFSLELPSGPGLGVKVDEDKLRHFARD